jgi:hypothetical protein
MPSTWNGFHFFLVFDTPILEAWVADGTTVNTSQYDLVWGASEALLPMYRAGSDTIILSKYIPWSRYYLPLQPPLVIPMSPNTTCRDPNPDQNLTYWLNFHPDWILYECDRVTPALLETDPYISLDFSNPEFVGNYLL